MRYFLNSVLAGIFIAIAATANLTVGGFAGACIFAVGLIMILQMKFNLFTGKVGVLLDKQVSIPQLGLIYLGNLIGTFIVALMFIVSPNALTAKAQAIVEIRNANGFFINAMRGMLCGLLVYGGVYAYNRQNDTLATAIAVAAFVAAGFNHCIADMFYISIGADSWGDVLTLIPTTLGNIVGCLLIPAVNLVPEHFRNSDTN